MNAFSPPNSPGIIHDNTILHEAQHNLIILQSTDTGDNALCQALGYSILVVLSGTRSFSVGAAGPIKRQDRSLPALRGIARQHPPPSPALSCLATFLTNRRQETHADPFFSLARATYECSPAGVRSKETRKRPTLGVLEFVYHDVRWVDRLKRNDTGSSMDELRRNREFFKKHRVLEELEVVDSTPLRKFGGNASLLNFAICR
ncbi:hypothetical protein B0H17DRAFT_1142227 [Mycena rosella]|uniref:Uncharacterized protein n=1 Tax=Mycena rosella TaxID=1033263 RepID=A0AAD7CY81_MYCRO|nr:hypothetical protein B0H17DRAFT_1142227 [Mycena rosella]